ncbi:hypothetical protein QQS21_009612 [Conoideocrella luteorostrata]|uniref:DNA replication checkpoint mediator MRC1 domain-containing protein n=1 Tax=Conoideocrella luteorostrata TaxID=1105319 RepID=A0AAJ0CHI8_9HYPO|nr:hypothetical protein QQS21_009612 [Conoideocrella luteorostrata]
MVSSRGSSPASRGGSAEPLTPRSKIRALLATVESSDEEGESQTKLTNPSLTGIGAYKTHRNPHSAQDDESDEPDIITRPRGKLASRMQSGEMTNKESKNTKLALESARERVRKMLELEEAEQNHEKASNGDNEGDEGDEDLPVISRRLKRRAPVDEESHSTEQPSRSPSPSLFVSSPMRPSPTKSTAEREDSDNDLPALKSDRFKALVQRKRQERLAREAAEEARKAERLAQQEKLASELEQLVSDEDDGGITDDEGGRRLTQEARPTRKAGRKAIEEMNRETQRLARSMQLAHEAKTRKKISKASLFERFNYRPAGGINEEQQQTNSSSRPNTPRSDVEMDDVDTPPSSPPLHQDGKTVATDTDVAMSMGGIKSLDHRSAADEAGKQQNPKRRVRVRLPVMPTNLVTFDSDDDLQITRSTKNKIDAVFDNIPSKKSSELHSLHALRALAQVKSPGKDGRKADKSKMTLGELEAYLHLKTRQQARLERDRRLEILKGQGIVVQTAEEREKQEQEVEDLVAKARQEAQKIMEEERDEAKRQRKEDGEVDPLAWDDSEDEEYQDAAEEADAELEVSGSDDEEAFEEDEEDEQEGHALFEEEADDAASADEPAAQDEDDDVEAYGRLVTKQRRTRNTTTVLSDDEVDVEATPRPVKMTTQMTPAAPRIASPGAPSSVLRSAKKTFIPGLPVQGPAGLGLTQIFAGTMDSQMSDSPTNGPTQSMMPDFDHFPDSNFSATADEPSQEMIVDSQQENAISATQGVQLNLSQSQMHGLGTLIDNRLETQISEMMEPSQDGGLQQHTPLRDRFMEPPFSTVETIIADKPNEEDMAQDSPLVRRGRLRRRTAMSIAETTVPEASEEHTPSTEGDAFKAMGEAAMREKKEKRLRVAEDFDRKKSKAKEMFEEQAEESEDEYAGLGGADGEDSDNESDGSVEEMIDDAAGNDNDDRKLAAFYADRERAQDEQQVDKLFKDITKGMLRRKRGADFDLSDSDDDGEARKRMKRRQFAKMQKALFADERVKKIAENPGNQAFLRTIEDHDSEDEIDFLDGLDFPSQQADSHQPQDDIESQQAQDSNIATTTTTTTTIPDSQPQPTKPKPLGVAPENRPPLAPHPRRTKSGKRPSNIGDVRETLSSLLDEPQGSIIPATEAGSDSEDDELHATSSSSSLRRSDKENQAPNLRRTTSVVDRISLKRNASSAGATGATRMAFTTQNSSSSFKVPALLRRATTNSSLMTGGSSASSSSSSLSSSLNGGMGSAGGFGEEAKIKKGAGKKSGINGFARENGQRVKMQQSERRRQERKVKGAEKRIGMVGGLLGRGAFE